MQELPTPGSCGSPLSLVQVLISLVKLILLHGPLIFFCIQASRSAFKKEDGLTRSLFGFPVYFLLACLGCLAVPLSYPWLLLWSLLWGAVGFALYRRAREQGGEKEGAYSALFFPVVFIVFLAGVLITGFLYPSFDHDPMTYQLHFAASWIKSGSVEIVATPFGDPSHAYGPQLASLFYVWLLLPLKSDMLAINGGFFFLALSVLACAGLARELGAEKGREWIAPLFLMLCPVLVHQGRSALNDIALCAFFLASLFFLVRTIRRGGGKELVAAFLALGLLAGCKYTALSLALLLTPLVVTGLFRAGGRKALAVLAGGLLLALAGGGYWYLRNWVVTGSPVYPFEIEVGKTLLFSGLYGREEMLSWTYHQDGAKEWLYTVVSVCSPGLLVFGALSCLGLIVRQRSALKKETVFSLTIIYVALLPLILDRLFWHVLPFQVNRFWIPWAGLLCAVSGAFLASRTWLIALAVVISWASLFLVPEEAPVLSRRVLFAFILAGGSLAADFAAHLVWKDRPGLQPRTRVYVYGGFALLVLFVFGFLFNLYPQRRQDRLLNYEYGKGWSVIGCLEEPSRISYTGANVPYLLHGPRLRHEVIYTGTSGAVMAGPHELAGGIEKHGFHTPEPMVSNLELCPRKWAGTLRESEADYLFVMAVPEHSLLNTAHVMDDGKAWPMEDSWARSCPRHFRPVHEDGFTRVYKLDFDSEAEKPCALDAGCGQRPADAVSACRYGGKGLGSACRRFFPAAPRVLQAADGPQ